METISLIKRLHQHRVWVNSNIVDVVMQLTEQQLHQSFPIGQGTIWKSLTHLYAAEFVWLEALLGNESPVAAGDVEGRLPGNQEAEDAMIRLDELRTRWTELDQRWQKYLDGIAADSLTDIVYKRNSVTGERLGTQRSDVLLHVCTHAQYTVAQVINMLRHVGISELPKSMLTNMAHEEPNGE